MLRRLASALLLGGFLASHPAAVCAATCLLEGHQRTAPASHGHHGHGSDGNADPAPAPCHDAALTAATAAHVMGGAVAVLPTALALPVSSPPARPDLRDRSPVPSPVPPPDPDPPPPRV